MDAVLPRGAPPKRKGPPKDAEVVPVDTPDVHAWLRGHLAKRRGYPLLVFPSRQLPPQWRDALHAAAADGSLSYPYARGASWWDCGPSLATLRADPLQWVVEGDGGWWPRGATPKQPVTTEPTAWPWDPRAPLPAWAPRGRPLEIDMGGSHAKWFSSAYNEAARADALRRDGTSARSRWLLTAGRACEAATAADGGTLSRNGLAAVVGNDVTAFSPSAAAAVYALLRARRVLDPCAGWGNRLFAALALGVAYSGVDPNPAVHEGYADMVADVARACAAAGHPMPPPPTLVCAPYEDVPPPHAAPQHPVNAAAPYDLVFTSPPFFDLEDYAPSAPTQSLQRATTAVVGAVGASEDRVPPGTALSLAHATPPSRARGLRAWLRGFLWPLLEHSYARLRDGGHLVLSINDYADTAYVGAMVAHVAEQAGPHGRMPGAVFLGVAGMVFTTKSNARSPLFVFVKQSSSSSSSSSAWALT